MATTTIQGFPYPVTSDAANVPSWLQQLAQAVEVKVNMIFSSTAARDAAIPSPTAGMECYITGTGEKQLRISGAWVVVGGRAAPFATAATTLSISVVSGAASDAGTWTFPTGRFSVTPIITVQISSGSGSAIGSTFLVYSATSTSAIVGIYARTTFPTTTTYSVFCQAIQMTSTSAAG